MVYGMLRRKWHGEYHDSIICCFSICSGSSNSTQDAQVFGAGDVDNCTGGDSVLIDAIFYNHLSFSFTSIYLDLSINLY